MIIYFKIFDKQCLNKCDGIEEQEAHGPHRSHWENSSNQ